MHNLENLNKAELQKLLKDLRLYKDLLKKVGNRGKNIFDRIFSEKNFFSVDYYGDLEESYVLENAKSVYKKVFDLDVDDSQIKLNKKQEIKGGIKIYFNDSLVDMSFSKFYNLLA